MRKYTKEVMQEALENAYSIAEVCRNLNLKPVGGNYKTIHKYCKLYDIDLSHLTGQDWKANSNLVKCKNSDSLEKMLQENTDVHSSHLREKLIASQLKTNVCEVCGCGDSWQNKPITLQLHHVNGDHFDNRIENLRILCPNCHSQAEGHKKPKTQTKGTQTAFKKHIHELKQCVCKYCGKTFTADRIDRTRKFCSQNCYREYIKQFGTETIQPRIQYSKWTEEHFIEIMTESKTISELARKLNSHRCTVREYLIKFGLYDEFKLKRQEQK